MTAMSNIGAVTDRVPMDLAERIDRELARALAEDWVTRLWDRDASLWTDDERVAALISNRLGWLDLPATFGERVDVLEAFAQAVRSDGFTAAVVCGMGGSSLAPEVCAMSLPVGETGIPVRVLDSTDPNAVRAASTASDPASTLYLIASKSGTTTETLAFLAHFWKLEDDIHADIPAGLAGEHFVAITDPGRSLDSIPHSDLFREVFLNPVDIGGRYSALTYVGLVPAALMGYNLRALLGDAADMAGQCSMTEQSNPGLWLGVSLGALADAGRDKLTLVIEPRYAALGGWIEQLVAESTGKRGMGIVPVVGEPLGDPGVYGDDRVFVRISSGTDTAWDAHTTSALEALAEAGHPVLELELGRGPGALGAEFFRWEFATAVAGAVLGINPFDEPNVTESKDNTNRVLETFRETGALPAAEVLATSGPLSLAGDAPMRLTTSENDDMVKVLRRHLARARGGGYVGIHAYLSQTPERDAALRGIAQLVRDRTTRAVTLGYGPRFLHSTGQLHKGGAPIGCFIQLTDDYGPDEDVPISGSTETFAGLIAAQAAGDFMSLESHDLPVINVNLSIDPDAGLVALREVLEAALDEPLAADAGPGPGSAAPVASPS
ncbi:MAG: glucose-6-phosphate isomerase [Candidatus Limnocylindrales bacterium]